MEGKHQVGQTQLPKQGLQNPKAQRPAERAFIGDTFVIGICGGDCSGKRLITNLFKSYFDKKKIKIAIVPQESFLIPNSEHNRYTPDAFDWQKMILAVQTLKAGKAANVHPFDKVLEQPSEDSVLVYPSQIIVIHGLHILHQSEIRKLISLSCYVDSDDDIRLSRRLYQDVSLRGKSIEVSVKNYLLNIKPSYELYTEPAKKVADLLVPKFGGNYTANEGNIQIAGFEDDQNKAISFILPAILDKIGMSRSFHKDNKSSPSPFAKHMSPIVRSLSTTQIADESTTIQGS